MGARPELRILWRLRRRFFEARRPEAFCFIHLEKTAGTTFHALFSKYFDTNRVSPTHVFNLHDLPASQLAHCDFISGHFDYAATAMIPKPMLKRISIFRDPVERLISFYRFHRCHPPLMAEANEFIALAQRYGPEEFFRHPTVVASSRINNAYLRAFGTSYKKASAEESKREVADALEIARMRIISLDALGLTEQMNCSIHNMLKQLGFEPPGKFESVHCTDEFAQKFHTFSEAPKVAKTEELRNAIEPLVYADRLLYEAATIEFQRRAASYGLAPSQEIPALIIARPVSRMAPALREPG
jgi:hypothetical protein